MPEPVRVAAVEAIGSRPRTDRPDPAGSTGRRRQGAAQLQPGRRGGGADAPEALRRVEPVGRADRCRATIPLGVRREALRTLAQQSGGARRILEMAKAGKLPDDLKTEATTLLHTTFTLDRRLREEAARVLPLPKMAARPAAAADRRAAPPRGQPRQGPGRLLPVRPELVRELPPRPGPGTVDRPRPLDHRHQVRQGRAAPVDPQPERGDRLQLPLGRPGPDRRPRRHRPAGRGHARATGAQDGRRPAGQSSGPVTIEDRKTSDVSLMPEGLAQTMSDQELVDLLAYPVHAPRAGEHRRPVSRDRPAARGRDEQGARLRGARSTSPRRYAGPRGRSSPGGGSTPTPRAWPT